MADPETLQTSPAAPRAAAHGAAHPLRRIAAFGVDYLILLLYMASLAGASLLLGLRVVGADGGRLARSRALLRAAMKFVPWELAHTCIWRIPGWPGAVETIPPGVMAGLAAVWLLTGFYLVLPWVDGMRRAPYDWIAGSMVVDVVNRGG